MTRQNMRSRTFLFRITKNYLQCKVYFWTLLAAVNMHYFLLVQNRVHMRSYVIIRFEVAILIFLFKNASAKKASVKKLTTCYSRWPIPRFELISFGNPPYMDAQHNTIKHFFKCFGCCRTSSLSYKVEKNEEIRIGW